MNRLTELKKLIGKTVVGVRQMDEGDLETLGWDGEAGYILELSDGSLLFASQDPEGNGPGSLWNESGPI
jgi:hypothetical protein